MVEVSGGKIEGDVIGRDSVTGSNPVIHNYAAGYTIEQHEAALVRRVAEIRADLERATSAEKRVLELEKVEALRKQADLERSWRETLARLEETQAALNRLSNEISPDRLKAAGEALEKGDFAAADRLFAEVEREADARSAAAAFQRGKIAYEQVRWHDARQFFEKAYRLASENFEYAEQYSEILFDLGDYVALETASYDLLEESKKKKGEASREFAYALNQLGVALDLQGDDKAGETLHWRALSIREKVLGLEHPDVAESLQNLSATVHAQGDELLAESLAQRALLIREKILGPDHPDTAFSLYGIGIIYHDRGEYKSAEALYRRALSIREKKLGPDHPYVAYAMRRLALTLWQSSGPSNAEPLLSRACEIIAKTLGRGQLDTQEFLKDLDACRKELAKP